MTNNVDNYFKQAGSSTDNELIVNGTFSSNKVVQTAIVTATLAEINAGKTLIDGVAGKTISIVGIEGKAVGTFAALTSVEVEDTNGTPVAIISTAVANLDDDYIAAGQTGNTIGAGYLGALTTGAGVAVTKTGSTGTGGTSITYKIDYIIS